VCHALPEMLCHTASRSTADVRVECSSIPRVGSARKDHASSESAINRQHLTDSRRCDDSTGPRVSRRDSGLCPRPGSHAHLSSGAGCDSHSRQVPASRPPAATAEWSISARLAAQPPSRPQTALLTSSRGSPHHTTRVQSAQHSVSLLIPASLTEQPWQLAPARAADGCAPIGYSSLSAQLGPEGRRRAELRFLEGRRDSGKGAPRQEMPAERHNPPQQLQQAAEPGVPLLCDPRASPSAGDGGALGVRVPSPECIDAATAVSAGMRLWAEVPLPRGRVLSREELLALGLALDAVTQEAGGPARLELPPPVAQAFEAARRAAGDAAAGRVMEPEASEALLGRTLAGSSGGAASGAGGSLHHTSSAGGSRSGHGSSCGGGRSRRLRPARAVLGAGGHPLVEVGSHLVNGAGALRGWSAEQQVMVTDGHCW